MAAVEASASIAPMVQQRGLPTLLKFVHMKKAFVGWTGGLVVTDPAASGFIGASRGTNATAELLAMCFATLCALQQPYSSVRIVYDAEYAAAMSQGRWDPSVNVDIIQTNSELIHLSSRLF